MSGSGQWASARLARQGGAPGLGSDRTADLALALAAALGLLAALQIGFVLRGVSPVLDGRLLDTDDYMRLARVAQLWASGAWFDPVFPRIAPDGLVLHWTRPMDALLLAGAWLARGPLGFERALYWWGVAVSPLLHLAAVPLMVWAARPLLSGAGLCLLPFLFLAQPGIFARFLAGRPDHHGLLLVGFIVLLGLSLRVLRQPARRDLAVAAGIAGGLALWVSVESLLALGLSIGALALAWLGGERHALRALLAQAAALVGTAAVALLLERAPADLLAWESDRISAAHLTLFGLNLGLWSLLALIERHRLMPASMTARGFAVLLGGLAAGALLWLFEPGLFADPMGGGDPLYRSIHLRRIEEIRPLFVAPGAEGTWAAALARPVLWLGLALPALPWLAVTLLRARGVERRLWAVVALAAVGYTALTLAQLRWSPYAEAVLLVPYAAMAAALFRMLGERLFESALALARPLLAASLCAWIYVPSVWFGTPPSESVAAQAAGPRCPLAPLAELLNDPAGVGARPATLLAMIDFGPELLYRTRHSVLAIPTHRRQPGFAAGYRIMTATDFAAARRLSAEWGVDLILICPGSAEDWFYDTAEEGTTLYQALRNGAPPDFLAPVPLPPTLAERFKLFAVN